MKIKNPEKFNDKEIINLIITLHSDHFTFVTNWGEFIFGEKLNLPPEHKNKIFCIWFSGLIDIVIDKIDQYDILFNECERRGLKNSLDVLKEINTLTDAIILQLSEINFEDQVLINHHRNTLVHARIYSIHNSKLSFLKFWNKESSQIDKYAGSKNEFWEMDRRKITKSLDDYLNPLRELFFNKNSEYYKILVQMSKTSFFENLTKKAYQDIK